MIPTTFRYQYQQSDFGTTRILTVLTGDQIVWRGDPWPHGIPGGLSFTQKEAALKRISRVKILESQEVAS